MSLLWRFQDYTLDSPPPPRMRFSSPTRIPRTTWIQRICREHVFKIHGVQERSNNWWDKQTIINIGVYYRWYDCKTHHSLTKKSLKNMTSRCPLKTDGQKPNNTTDSFTGWIRTRIGASSWDGSSWLAGIMFEMFFLDKMNTQLIKWQRNFCILQFLEGLKFPQQKQPGYLGYHLLLGQSLTQDLLQNLEVAP